MTKRQRILSRHSVVSVYVGAQLWAMDVWCKGGIADFKWTRLDHVSTYDLFTWLGS